MYCIVGGFDNEYGILSWSGDGGHYLDCKAVLLGGVMSEDDF